MNNGKAIHLKRDLITLICLMISAVSFSQTSQDFSGSWSLNLSKSDTGEGGPGMISQNISIAQKANSFKLERSFTGQDGNERKISETYTLDGKESVNPVFNTSKKSIAEWSSDKESLVVSSILVFEMNGESTQIKTVEVYKLAQAGKSLSIDSRSTSSMGERKTLLVYDKK